MPSFRRWPGTCASGGRLPNRRYNHTQAVVNVAVVQHALPRDAVALGIQDAVRGAYDAALQTESFRQQIGFVRFSWQIVFSMFTTFLLPLWSLSFATEALGREREQQNLLWLLTRPLPRPAIYLAKFVALLPWCLLLNLGGFTLLCLVAGAPASWRCVSTGRRSSGEPWRSRRCFT